MAANWKSKSDKQFAALDRLQDHVRAACSRRGLGIGSETAERVVEALLAAGVSPNTVPSDTRILAELRRIGERTPEEAEREARLRAAAKECGLTGLVVEPLNDGFGYAAPAAVKVAFPGGSARTLNLRIHVGRIVSVESLLRDGRTVDVVASGIRSKVVPKIERIVGDAAAVATEFESRLASFLAEKGAGWQKQLFLADLSKRLSQNAPALKDGNPYEIALRTFMFNALSAAERAHGTVLATVRLRIEAGFGDYAAMFPTARAMGRRLTLIVGPTNSGKTHEAMTIAEASTTSRILSPLRLLALEHYERLLSKGLVAGMVTGEEVLGPPRPDHIAQTIETLDTFTPVDTVIIDEIQMLADSQRGWAWSEAVLGAPAAHVVMTGSVDSVELVQRIAAMTGEPLEIIRLERKNPLHSMPRPLGMPELRRGDALIAFSRRDLFDLREEVRSHGLSVASVYGALSPEVRRSEAKRFRDGEADILVATDAIGMGLNIGALKRVVFSATEKYDGVSTRDLTDSEIRQIAGRAGRFGATDPGLAGSLRHGERVSDPHRISEALKGTPEPIGLSRLMVKPTTATVSLASTLFKDLSLAAILARIEDMVSHEDQVEMVDLSEMKDTAVLLKDVRLPIEMLFTYCMAPLDRRSDWSRQEMARWAAAHAAGRPVDPPRHRGSMLQDLEQAGKLSVLYLWLSRKFPKVYVHAEAVRDERGRLDSLIEAELIRTSTARVQERAKKAPRASRR